MRLRTAKTLSDVIGEARRPRRRRPRPEPPPEPPRRDPRWGTPVRLGPHLRLQARTGRRAAVIELHPGLYLVADLPEEMARTGIGFVPLLAPLIVTAAKKALDGPRREPERRALPGPVADDAAELEAAPAAEWIDDEDVAEVLVGCSRCPRRQP